MINQPTYFTRFKLLFLMSLSAVLLLFGCTTSNLPPDFPEVGSAPLVTPAAPVIPTATTVIPPTEPAPVAAEIDEGSTGYPEPEAPELASADAEQNIQDLSYPAPTQQSVLSDSPVPTLPPIESSSSVAEAAPIATVPIEILPNGSLNLGWSDLIPADFTADSIYQKYQEELVKYPAGDPKIQELQAQMQEEFNNAPTNEALNGKLVRVPGFVTPLDFAEDTVTEFLLVPYFGACIHVPAPPTNQTVFVSTIAEGGIDLEDTYVPIWVTGVLQTESKTTDLATAGYTIQDATIELYSDQ